MKILTVVGARPQFIKAAAVSRETKAWNESGNDPHIDDILVHTGQHYDENMSQIFFDELGLASPHHHLGIAGGGHGDMTGRMLQALEPLIQQEQPDWVVVHGDTNSTMAGALAAAKLNQPSAHIEAGLRSFERGMPEEVNRVVADAVCDLLFAPTEAAMHNLRSEGVPRERIVLSGDLMYDAALHYMDIADQRSTALKRLGLAASEFVLATVHRAENTDDPHRLAGIVEGLLRLAEERPVVLPLHPRTGQALTRAGLRLRVEEALILIEPLGYLDMLQMEQAAALIATDSGGVQKEAYFAGTPCITLREETEWIELIEVGANVLVGADPDRIDEAASRLTEFAPVPGLYGDGKAGRKVLNALAQSFRDRCQS